MDFVEMVKNLCRERKIALSKLEKDLGFSNGYIAGLRRGTMPYDRMTAVAEYLGVSLGDLSMERETEHKIPVLGYVRAGELTTEYENVLDYIASDYDPAEYFALMVKGDSMTPRLFEGDIVIVRKQNTVENGDYAVVQVNGDEAVVKKVLVFAHGLGLQSLNPNYPLVQFNETEIAEKPVRVLGKVVEMRGRM